MEVKLRLKDKAAHDKVVALLQDQQTHLYRQHNYFYDGPNGELSRNRTILRVRWFNEDEKVVITVKGRMAVQDGVGRAVEDESEVDVATAKHFHEDPARILQLQLPVIQALKACAPAARRRREWSMRCMHLKRSRRRIVGRKAGTLCSACTSLIATSLLAMVASCNVCRPTCSCRGSRI